METLILASTSRWRRQLLEEAGIEAECIAPGVDEGPIIGKTPEETALLGRRPRPLSRTSDQAHWSWVRIR